MAHQRLLVAFDFDHTIVEENSDVVARKLLNVDLIPDHIRRLHQTKGWTEYMEEIFKMLHTHKVSRENIVEAMQKLTPTERMPELLEWLRNRGHETIIISDSNSVFINEWLRHRKLQNCVKRVFTNPASFGENGLLSVQPYHQQDWCNLSTINLCKGHILETYIKERQDEGATFAAIAYVGDGQNDFCPALKLSKNDFVFPRSGFPLHNMLRDHTQERKVVATICPWITATEIIKVLDNFLL